METSRTIEVTLPDDVLADLDAAVAEGRFPSVNWVIEQALADRLYHMPESIEELEQLRSLWKKGIASGPARQIDLAAMKRRGRARMAERRAAA